MGNDPKKRTPIEATVEVERFGRRGHRYEARPARMTIGGTSVSFRTEDFVTYGWTQRGARKRCLRKVISYLKQRARDQGK
jgi:hypothetical protein